VRTKRNPPRSPLLTWDEEQTAKEAAANNETTPLCSPEAIAGPKQKKARFSHQQQTCLWECHQCIVMPRLGLFVARTCTTELVVPGKLFSAQATPAWTSHHFQHQFAIPLLEQMRLKGEPALWSFSNHQGHRLQDKICSMHT
jgi:hypothetical protein